MENVTVPQTEIEPNTKFGKSLVELAQRLDNWCETDTDITHRQARMAVGLAVIGGAAVVAGWGNAGDYMYKTLLPQGVESWPVLETNLTSLVKKLVTGPAEITTVLPGGVFGQFTVNLSSDQRHEALDGLLKVEGRQVTKMVTAEMAFLAGIGVVAVGGLLGSKEKIKGSTGVGQWAAGVMKSVGELL